jgi:hypothetical protein
VRATTTDPAVITPAGDVVARAGACTSASTCGTVAHDGPTLAVR